ncbi:MAG: hypothetical protein JRH07_08635, partial [Deltaproteobacteria bacterium]|nr:hypothetical protein [Deltaproteobacteria bacterium]
LGDQRVRIHYTDGRTFIKKASGRYDVIIINLPDPMTAQLNRFYTVEFLREAARVMTPEGVLSLSATSSENIIGPTLAQYLRSVYRTMKEVFPEIIVFPGATARFFGSSHGKMVSDPRLLVDRIRQRHLRLRFVREYYIIFNLSKDRQEYLRSFLEGDLAAAPTNHDLKPVCYFYDAVHWSAQYEPFFKGVFLRLARVRLWEILCGLGLITLALSPFASRPGEWSGKRAAILPAVLASGWTEMTLEVVLLLAFQVFYGFLYEKLGLIIAGFMIGLVTGSWTMTRTLLKMKNPLKNLIALQLGLACYGLVVLLVVLVLQGLPKLSGNFLVIEILFPFLTGVAGFLGGLHFPLANRIYLGESTRLAATAGLVNGIDLVGSSAGALLAGVVLLPVFGIPQTLCFISALNLSAVFLLVLAKRTHPSWDGQPRDPILSTAEPQA